MCVILSSLSIAALWSPVGKGLTSCHFPMWYPWSGVALDFVSYLAFFFFFWYWVLVVVMFVECVLSSLAIILLKRGERSLLYFVLWLSVFFVSSSYCHESGCSL